MRSFLKTAILLTATATVISGCTIDRPTRSDGEGPAIDITFSGGADFVLLQETRGLTPADNCAIVRDVAGGSVNNRSVDLSVAVFDRSGMNSLTFTVEGEGIRDGSVVVTPATNPLLNVDDGRDVDEIALTFLPTGGGVLNGAVVQFTIDSAFTAGVTLSAVGVDSFGNTTRFAPFELLSELAVGICNY